MCLAVMRPHYFCVVVGGAMQAEGTDEEIEKRETGQGDPSPHFVEKPLKI